jgi:hypothetical protein
MLIPPQGIHFYCTRGLVRSGVFRKAPETLHPRHRSHTLTGVP